MQWQVHGPAEQKMKPLWRRHPSTLVRKFAGFASDPDLVYKLLHTRLQAPHLELDCDQFVGAHDGVLRVDPSLLQGASVSLL